MPFPHPPPTISRRPRRKDKDGRLIISRSSSSRKHKDGTRPINRSPSLIPQAPTAPIYIQNSTTVDPLPEELPLPESESGTASPTSTASFDFPSNRNLSSENTSSETYSISPPKLPRLPATLQPYLEEDFDDVTPIQTSKGLPTEPEPFNPSSYFPPHGSRAVQTTLKSEHEARQVPLADSPAKSIQRQNSHRKEETPNHTTSPVPLNKTLGSRELPPPEQIAQQWATAGSIQLHSPPPPSSCSWFEPRPLSGSVPINQPYLYGSNYLPSSQSLIHPPHYRSTFPAEQFIPSPYSGPPFIHMAQPNGHPMDANMALPQQSPFFPGYGFSQAPPLQPQSLRSPPIQGYGFLGSRGSISGDPFQGAPIPTANDFERAQTFEGQGPTGHEEEDAINLLHRIQIAIPDLHQLVNKYRETSGRLGAKEDHLRQTEAEKVELLKQREADIDRLRKELETMISKHGAESSKLRLEIGNLEEKHREMQDGLTAKTRSQDQLEATNQQLRLLQGELEERNRTDRDTMTLEFNDWKTNITDEYMMKQRALEEELRHRLRESEASLSTLQTQITDTNRARMHEKEALSSGFSQTRQELEDNHTKVRKGLEIALENRQIELEGAHMRHLDRQATWQKECTTIKRDWDEERNKIEKDCEEQRRGLHLQHKNEADDMQKTHAALQARCKTLENENTKLQKDIQKLKGEWDDDKVKFGKAKDQLNSTAQMLNKDNEKLQKMVEAFGEATDFRSRGDAYFIDAFASLRKQISDLADDHFITAIEVPPNSIMDKVPESFPPFLSDTESANQLRALYVQHIISRMLHERIFEPFLFTLPWRLKDADILFKEMSQKTRRKSVRREAVWRQHTLHAAYTASSAKQSINKIAAIIVDDIVDEIKYFANPSSWEHVTVGVRRIVKLAAETWRYARLEREMITASFPPAIPPLIEYVDENTFGVPSTQGQQREVLLSLLPMIEREPAHECHRTTANMDDQGCIYSLGTFLSSDDPAVLARLAELQRVYVPADTMPQPEEQASQRRSAFTSDNQENARSPTEPTVPSHLRSLPDSRSSIQVPHLISHYEGKLKGPDMHKTVEARDREEEKISTQYGSMTSNSQSSADTSMNQPSSSSYDAPTGEVLPPWGNSHG